MHYARCLRVKVRPQSDKAVQQMGSQNRAVTHYVVKIVNHDSHQQVQNLQEKYIRAVTYV